MVGVNAVRFASLQRSTTSMLTSAIVECVNGQLATYRSRSRICQYRTLTGYKNPTGSSLRQSLTEHFAEIAVHRSASDLLMATILTLRWAHSTILRNSYRPVTSVSRVNSMRGRTPLTCLEHGPTSGSQL